MKIIGNFLNLFKKASDYIMKSRVIIILFGAGSLIWFLIRVIPKPSRAAYPCMKAAAPMASAFILYMLSLAGSLIFFKKAWKAFLAKKYLIGLGFATIVIITLIVSMINNQQPAFASVSLADQISHLSPNEPMGEAKGIFPGRVVWVHDPTATDASCDPNAYQDSYWESDNTDQNKVDAMLSAAIRNLTGALSDEDAWDSIFYYYNQQKGKGRIDYNTDEKIFIKINATSTWDGNINLSTFYRNYNNYYGVSETSPHVIEALLEQLVNNAGVPENKIYIGDPMKHIYQDNFLKWKNSFPNVHYLDNEYTYDGREVATVSNTSQIIYSDSGAVLNDGGAIVTDFIYSIFEDAEYVLNVPNMKAHKHGGVTMFAKNHFGSQSRPAARHLHKGLVHTEQTGGLYRTSYGMYRVTVDLMGHNLLSGKNLVYIMDALFSSPEEVTQPVKMAMTPFNNHWTSSLFASFDPVAIESVGFDFLYAEFDETAAFAPFPHMGAVDDYLEQAADQANWPEGIIYDPEGDGIPLQSLGVHEHWDSPLTKRYSRNLGTGTGIELNYLSMIPDALTDVETEPVKVYPNPFRNVLTFDLGSTSSDVYRLSIYDLQGKLVFKTNFKRSFTWDAASINECNLETGYYFYQIKTNDHIIKSGKALYR